MSKSAKHDPTLGGCVVRNTTRKISKQTTDSHPSFMQDEKLSEDLKTCLSIGRRAPGGTKVLGGPPEIHTKEGKKPRTSFEATSHALTKDKRKSKQNEMQQTEQTAERPLWPEKYLCWKVRIAEGDTKSPGQKTEV
nr:hypothetical protein [Tanacetum cinerariifolium]